MNRHSSPLPSSMTTRYQSVWGDSLTTIAASYGVDARQVAQMSGIDPFWHNVRPLPPGTALVIPLHPVPARTIVASSPDKKTDPRGQLAFPAAATTITARKTALPLPIGI